jgi:hypothetical protein
MIYTIYSTQDTTLYEKTESLNTSGDSILELSHDMLDASSSAYNSRIILKFNTDEIEDHIKTGKITSDVKYFLSLKSSYVQEIPYEYKINVYPISGSWINGTGHYANRPISTDGASWKYRSSKAIGKLWELSDITEFVWDITKMTWADLAQFFGNAGVQVTVTSSYQTNPGGGTWWLYENLHCTQSFKYETSDLYVNVTPIIEKYVTSSGRLVNDGMIIKFEDELEKTPGIIPSLKFFSRESNTIYVPKLYIVWDDSQFNTGSLSEADFENLVLNVKLKKYYSQNEKSKIRIYANSRYPQKYYTTQSYHLQNYYLPSSSYYEIRDAHSDEVIIPFDKNGTKISCDEKGSYFNLWMSSFQPERFYRILIHSEKDDGYDNITFDNNYYFKVTR